MVRTRSNRCGPNQSDASSNRCVRRIASGPARIGADRTDSAHTLIYFLFYCRNFSPGPMPVLLGLNISAQTFRAASSPPWRVADPPWRVANLCAVLFAPSVKPDNLPTGTYYLPTCVLARMDGSRGAWCRRIHAAPRRCLDGGYCLVVGEPSRGGEARIYS